VADYKPPKDSDKLDEETRTLHAEGCAPSHGTLPTKHEEGESMLKYISVEAVTVKTEG
jgi:RNA-binding motif X-linked protein 2